MRTQSYGNELASVYSRSMEDTETRVCPSLSHCAVDLIPSRGELKIAEVASRFPDVDEFVSLISSVGFKMNAKVKSVRNTWQ